MTEEPVDFTAALDVLTALAARSKPLSPAEYRAFALKDQVFPMLQRWGFEPRFQCEHAKLHPKQAATLNSVRGMMKRKGAIVALVGERGLGKTTIASLFAIDKAWSNYHEAMKESPLRFESVIYRKCAKLIARYKPLFSDFGSIETESLLESFEYLAKEQEYVVIDELHDCDDLKMKTRVLTDLIDRRYACRRDTILIANQTPADFEATIGDSILSRLNEHGGIIECKWPSYRQ